MSFFAFKDDNIFQLSQFNKKDSNGANRISSDAIIKVQVLLSATLYNDTCNMFYEEDQNHETIAISISFEQVAVSFFKEVKSFCCFLLIID